MPGPLGAPRAHPVPTALPGELSPQPCPSPASQSLVSRPVPGSGMNKPVALHNQGCRFSPDGCLRPAAARPPPLPVPGVPGSRARAAGCVARALSPSPSPSSSLPGRLSEAVTGSAKAPQLRSLPPPSSPPWISRDQWSPFVSCKRAERLGGEGGQEGWVLLAATAQRSRLKLVSARAGISPGPRQISLGGAGVNGQDARGVISPANWGVLLGQGGDAAWGAGGLCTMPVAGTAPRHGAWRGAGAMGVMPRGILNGASGLCLASSPWWWQKAARK